MHFVAILLRSNLWERKLIFYWKHHFTASYAFSSNEDYLTVHKLSSSTLTIFTFIRNIRHCIHVEGNKNFTTNTHYFGFTNISISCTTEDGNKCMNCDRTVIENKKRTKVAKSVVCDLTTLVLFSTNNNSINHTIEFG